MSQITATKILEKLENIDARVTSLLTKLGIKKEQQEPCPVGTYRDPETGECVGIQCPKGEHFDIERNECVPDTDIPKTESFEAEGLTSITHYEEPDAPEELQEQWEREDKERELSENPTITS